MGIWDAITELVEAATPWTVVEAEAPAKEEDSKDDGDKKDESKDEDKDDKEDSDDKGEEKEGDDEGGDDEEGEEEEDDEEEIVDPKETLEEECKQSKQCAPAKHHFDECVERVTAASDGDGDSKEDCVEEFFHLAHCASQCAAPKLWTQLK